MSARSMSFQFISRPQSYLLFAFIGLMIAYVL
jgi:hypothetical protein